MTGTNCSVANHICGISPRGALESFSKTSLSSEIVEFQSKLFAPMTADHKHNLHQGPGSIADFLPFLELSLSDPYGLPTLMPQWQALEQSQWLRPLVDVEIAKDIMTARTLVIIHVFDPSRLRSLFLSLRKGGWIKDLLISTDTAEKAREIEGIHRQVFGTESRMQIHIQDNLGRDILPFWVSLLKYGAGYDYFLKLHLKRSLHGDSLIDVSCTGSADFGTLWSDDLYRSLIPSSFTEYQQLLTWMNRRGLGCIYPRPFREVVQFGWAEPSNFVWVARILSDFKINGLNQLLPLFYPAGNMFWGSMSAFLPLAAYFSSDWRYPPEPLGQDGTFLHAVERSYSYLLADSGFKVGLLFPPSAQFGSIGGLRGVGVDMEWLDGRQSPTCHEANSTIYDLYSLYVEATLRERAKVSKLIDEVEGLQRNLPEALLRNFFPRLFSRFLHLFRSKT